MFHVLLVDDEPSVTDALQRSINWESLELEVAAVAQSGAQALTCIAGGPIDIVITDIRMANMDGLSLCQQIARMDRHIQTIIISGFAEFSYAQKALSYGALAYCLKPLEYDELRRHLQRAVHRLKKLSHMPDHDDLLDALQNADSKELDSALACFGLHADIYYAAVCTGKAPFPLPAGHQGIHLRLGYRQDGYIAARPFPAESIHRYLEDPQSQGLSFTEQGCPVDGLAQTIKDLGNASFQFFVEPERKLFPRHQEDRAAPLLREIARAAARGTRHTLTACWLTCTALRGACSPCARCGGCTPSSPPATPSAPFFPPMTSTAPNSWYSSSSAFPCCWLFCRSVCAPARRRPAPRL